MKKRQACPNKKGDTKNPAALRGAGEELIVKIRELKAAFPYTVPVLTGYLFLGMAYGILMHSAGYPLWYAPMMSLLVYAGSMQYAAVPLLGAPFDPLGALMLTLMVNARHLFYGVSMLKPYRAAGRKWPYLVFAMSDETFSINVSAQPPEGVDRGWLFFWVSLLDQSYWVAACAFGGAVGEALTFDTRGIEFVMTALFVTVFAGQWQAEREHRPALAGLGASLACLALFGADAFILPAMLLIIGLLLALRGPLTRAEQGKGEGRV